MGFLGRYLTGLCVATLGLCVAGWLVLMPLAFGYRGSGPRGAALHGAALHGAALHGVALTDRATGGGLALVSLVTLLAWAVAWRRKLRADGIVARTSRRQAWRESRARRRRERGSDKAGSAPDPAQVLGELRALLLPLLAGSANGGERAGGEPVASPRVAGVPAPGNEQEAFGTPGGFQSPSGDPGQPGPGGPAPGDLDSYQTAPEGYHPTPAASDHYPPAPDFPAVPPARSGIANIESMLAGAELLMVGGEEEAW
jgi:hypothetical protein